MEPSCGILWHVPGSPLLCYILYNIWFKDNPLLSGSIDASTHDIDKWDISQIGAVCKKSSLRHLQCVQIINQSIQSHTRNGRKEVGRNGYSVILLSVNDYGKYYSKRGVIHNREKVISADGINLVKILGMVIKISLQGTLQFKELIKNCLLFLFRKCQKWTSMFWYYYLGSIFLKGAFTKSWKKS